MSEPLRLMDLFAGCGGLTSGFVQTGDYTPVAAVEIDPSAAATYALNFGEHVFVGDIHNWAEGPLPHADVVVGGPPCQGFSPLGKQDPNDPRSALWREYVEVIRRVRPTFFVIENVPQFLQSSQYEALRAETDSRDGILCDWTLEAFVLNAADYGVAQTRRRAVVIGRRAGVSPVGPPEPRERQPTVRDALADVPRMPLGIDLPHSQVLVNGTLHSGPFKTVELHLTRKVSAVSRARFEAIPPGGNRHNIPVHLLPNCWKKHTTGAADVMGRLFWDRPSVTIRTEFFKPEKGRYLHPEEHRPITHYEAALIQGFPEDYLWAGSKVSLARQIGNAVPPPLARAIAEHLAERIAR